MIPPVAWVLLAALTAALVLVTADRPDTPPTPEPGWDEWEPRAWMPLYSSHAALLDGRPRSRALDRERGPDSVILTVAEVRARLGQVAS